MLKLTTSRFGVLETEEDKIIYFPAGLIGLPDLKKYIIIDHKNTPVKWLQSVDDPDMAFIVTSPDTLTSDFTIDFDRTVRQHMQFENEQDLVVLVIIRVSGEDVIANFLGPLVINSQNKTGVQIILERREKILTEIR